MKRLFRRKHPHAGWECFACAHREHCPYKKTFWKDVGASLYRHGHEHHPNGHDYAIHVPTGWERTTNRRTKP